jgi:hypothetical protein
VAPTTTHTHRYLYIYIWYCKSAENKNITLNTPVWGKHTTHSSAVYLFLICSDGTQVLVKWMTVTHFQQHHNSEIELLSFNVHQLQQFVRQEQTHFDLVLHWAVDIKYIQRYTARWQLLQAHHTAETHLLKQWSSFNNKWI